MRFALVMGEVGQGLRRNLSMVVSVVLVTFISLTFVGASALLQLQVNEMRQFWSERAQVVVYMCTEAAANCEGVGATDGQTEAVQAELDSEVLQPYIASMSYDTPEQSYDRFVQQFSGTPSAELGSAENFGGTFYVNLVDPTQFEVLTESLAGLAGVDEVVNQLSYLAPIFDALNASSVAAIGIAALMLVAAVLLIATTIRLSAFSRRRELGIMRLVGASNAFIKTPFILEGIVAALIGSALACVALIALVRFFVGDYLTQQLTAFSFIDLNEVWLVLPLVVGVGVLLSALSAQFAISRYLRV